MTRLHLSFFLIFSLFLPCGGTMQGEENASLANIQRTMARIAASTLENPATVRWEFYGQSITAQPWTKIVEQDLTERFPSVKFEFHKPAIGGFTSPSLIRTAEHDLYPWYPDLLVFHVYGPTKEYEEIIKRTRARTTAEIVLWTSHLKANETLDKDRSESERLTAIREIAKRYDCMLIDVRLKWIEYLKTNELEPSDLLRDSVHLNEDGVAKLGEFIASELVAAKGLVTTPQAGTVTEIPLDSPQVGQDENGNLSVRFKGNRIVALSDGTGDGDGAEVLIDGRKPAEFPEHWAVSRPSTGPGIWMPAIKNVSFEKTPVEEDWKLICLPDSKPDGSRIHFKVIGSVTGDDGAGYSDEAFVSTSGRVVIRPEDWHLKWSLGYKKLELPEGFEVKWKTYPLFTGIYRPQPVVTETVVIQNCSNEDHEVTFGASGGKLGIKSFRVYSPALSQELP